MVYKIIMIIMFLTLLIGTIHTIFVMIKSTVNTNVEIKKNSHGIKDFLMSVKHWEVNRIKPLVVFFKYIILTILIFIISICVLIFLRFLGLNVG